MARRQVESYSLGLALMPNVTYNLSSQSMTSAQVDSWLQCLAGISFVGTLNITGNTSPSVPSGMYAAAALQTAGATVTSDCAIISQDTLFTVNVDGTWKLSVVTAGAGTTYLWQYQDANGDWITTGVTTATYDNPPRNESSAIDPDTLRYYRCAVTRNAVTVYSTQEVSRVAIISAAGNPESADLNVSDPLTLVCIGSTGDGLGTEPVYSWTKDGVATGVTGDTFSIASVVLGDAGSYRCVITMPNGAKTTSSAAVVTVS